MQLTLFKVYAKLIKNNVITPQDLIKTIDCIEDDYLNLLWKLFIVKVIKEN